ncbi:hypothetical protein B7463_g7952, partial [Scytalidium lignicola]
MVNLIDLFHQKLELFRLEQRYTRRRHRRSTFVSEAQYVDGEYIYNSSSAHATSYSAKISAGHSPSPSPRSHTQNPWSTSTSGSGSGSGSDSDRSEEREREYERDQVPEMREPRPQQKDSVGRGLGRRLSRMSMGGSLDWKNRGQSKRESMASGREVRWEDGARS